jgi:hypothetical protein
MLISRNFYNKNSPLVEISEEAAEDFKKHLMSQMDFGYNFLIITYVCMWKTKLLRITIRGLIG